MISVLRDGSGFVPKADTVVEAGDEVLVVLDPGLEDAITAQFVADGDRAALMAERNVDILIVGGGLAGASCAEGLRERGLRRLGAARRAASRTRPTSARRARRTCCAASPSPTTRTCTRTSGTRSNDIELLTRTSVMKLDPAAQDGGALAQADGALRPRAARHRRQHPPAARRGRRPRRHPLPAHARHRRRRCARTPRTPSSVVLIGGSYIACEVAASLTTLGKQCTLVMLEDAPLSTGFGDRRRGAFFAGAARLARDRVRDRRRRGALRGRAARGAGRDASRARRSTPTSS